MHPIAPLFSNAGWNLHGLQDTASPYLMALTALHQHQAKIVCATRQPNPSHNCTFHLGLDTRPGAKITMVIPRALWVLGCPAANAAFV